MEQTADSSLLAQTGLKILPRSLVRYQGNEYGLIDTMGDMKLVVMVSSLPAGGMDLEGEAVEFQSSTLRICPLNSHNAAALRARLPWLQPQLLGLKTSAGMGDRLGLATPGHVRAIRHALGKIAPIFAQQSIREMMRTGRTPPQVMDDALWGVFQEGWQGGFGADADHLKTPQDIDACLSAGFTFFTIDPGEYVDHRAETASLNDLLDMTSALPATITDEARSLLNRTFDLEGRILRFTEYLLYKAMVKYGRAVHHVAMMFHHLEQKAGIRPFELEISVDETENPTSHAEHIFIATLLKKYGVRWVSLAPRFVGCFEKGVDYIGDPADFEADIAGHAAIARVFGPYKLSLHSGSDKFSIYPAAMRQTQGLVHLKTAGTSYLEALRTIAALDEELFHDIYKFAREQYESDRASYHVSAELIHAPLPGSVKDWPALLDQFDAREILHVTFGSVLTRRKNDGTFHFYDRLIGFLKAHPEAYAENLERHFVRHLSPFIADE